MKKSGDDRWSRAVRARFGKCMGCGKLPDQCQLHAHHWWCTKARSLRLRFDIDNGIALCYSCHIGKVHQQGDGFFIDFIRRTMTEIVGQEKVDQMTATRARAEEVPLEELREIIGRLPA